jgi:hypothetical protein
VLILKLTVTRAVVQASDLPSSTFSRKVFVKVVAGGDLRRTNSIKQDKNACIRLDAKFFLYASLQTPTGVKI